MPKVDSNTILFVLLFLTGIITIISLVIINFIDTEKIKNTDVSNKEKSIIFIFKRLFFYNPILLIYISLFIFTIVFIYYKPVKSLEI